MRTQSHHSRALPCFTGCLLALLAAVSLPHSARAQYYDDDHDRGPRLRLGIEAGAGWVFGDADDYAATVRAQIGVQLNDLVALYWQPGLNIYGWGGGDDPDRYVFTSQLGMVDFTLGHGFQLGVGAGVDIGDLGTCVQGDCEIDSGEVQFATGARAAFVIPLGRERARWGIPIGATGHITWFEGDQVYSVMLTAGFMSY